MVGILAYLPATTRDEADVGKKSSLESWYR
jgi:hypothetical protein